MNSSYKLVMIEPRLNNQLLKAQERYAEYQQDEYDARLCFDGMVQAWEYLYSLLNDAISGDYYLKLYTKNSLDEVAIKEVRVVGLMENDTYLRYSSKESASHLYEKHNLMAVNKIEVIPRKP